MIYRLLGNRFRATVKAGCTLRRVLEPTLAAEGVAALGEGDRNLRVPNFIVLSWVKGNAPPAT